MANEIRNQPPRAAFDVQGAQDLREQMKKDPKAGVKMAAQQFEAMFLQMVLKSMRDTVPSDGLMNSDQSRFYNGMLDQQMAQDLTTNGRGLGFARLIEQQLGRNLGVDTAEGSKANVDLPAILAGNQAAAYQDAPKNLRYAPILSGLPTSASYAKSDARSVQADTTAPQSAREFTEQVWPHAVEASRTTGIAPQFVVAHAALESGWGKSQILRADGSPSYNLFGVKAGRSWQGDSVEVPTTEYVDGKPVKVTERFRAYSSYAEAFRDYASLLRNNPRYSDVIGSQSGTEFARRVQQAGYATDPSYADKLTKIINGPTLRQALIG